MVTPGSLPCGNNLCGLIVEYGQILHPSSAIWMEDFMGLTPPNRHRNKWATAKNKPILCCYENEKSTVSFMLHNTKMYWKLRRFFFLRANSGNWPYELSSPRHPPCGGWAYYKLTSLLLRPRFISLVFTVVKQAKLAKSESWAVVILVIKSFIKMKKRTGPRIGPWGTPLMR